MVLISISSRDWSDCGDEIRGAREQQTIFEAATVVPNLALTGLALQLPAIQFCNVLWRLSNKATTIVTLGAWER